ncbi:Alpha/Beta hydrolase protein [Lasiosphaeria miniovina]|uniref:Alpha/Beta hydrolase protein n=1 Tax=Lasiosphaeria miniovina TaxID=1954250 RepID=A0AA40AWJ7_9PEZI|nr:Alpha/Beta hydrolase protein [Lasiosphaeria miniovina]KAK0723326.1 Alpha/Beta hydrolase protein [Lasiosphaeria miniovina]
MAGPGMLYVTMQPSEGLSAEQFHEWYNNEHGPTRLRMPHMFGSGLRYRATDSQQPHFLATYDVTAMALLDTPTYTDLRAHRSPREADTIGQVDVDRRFLDLVHTQHTQTQAPPFVAAEHLPDADAEGLILVSVEISLKPGVDGADDAVVKWYQEEHIPMLSRVPGWLRSRIFRTPSAIEAGSSATAQQPARLVALHDFAKDNGLGGQEHEAAKSTPRRGAVFAQYIATKTRRAYELFYVFGPAPRDLHSLSKLPSAAAFTAPDGSVATVPGAASISAHVTTADGLGIPYRLEGNPAPGAPTVAFCNSLLTSLHMWDALVTILKARRPDLRILRYDTRGRHAVPADPPVPATLDMLADDLAVLLAALHIQRLHALVGVSMGGATALNFALRHPALLSKFVACDFNAASSAANTAAWKGRIAVAESGDAGMKELAAATVGRWFHPHTMAAKAGVAASMRDMVAANSVQGFRFSCQALWDYDMRPAMPACAVPGLFVVGEGDANGALVKAMDGFRGLLGPGGVGAELKVVPLAGHLPMCEAPAEFWEAVEAFL